MSLYTDYEVVIPKDPARSWVGHGEVCNTIVDLLAAHADFTIVRRAAAGVCDVTNYAEVCWHNIYFKFYLDSTFGQIMVGASYTIHSTSAGYGKTLLNTNNVSVTIRLRVYNCKTGVLVKYFTASNWAYLVQGSACTSLSDTAPIYFILAQGLSNGSAVMVDDALCRTYMLSACTQVFDVAGVRQILAPMILYAYSGNSAAANYINTEVYFSPTYLQTGIVQIGDKYFHIDAIAVELLA